MDGKAIYLTTKDFIDAKDGDKYYNRPGMQYTGSQSKARLEELKDYIKLQGESK